MKGSLFAFFGGALITLQGVANSRISQDIGTWQAATITQLTGFIMALLILIFVRDGKWQRFNQVKGKRLILSFKSPLDVIGDIEYVQCTDIINTVEAVSSSQ
jgi:bacterial/archaeal transporter family-2 protein